MENNITVLVDAKTEYTKQLSGILVPFIYEGINSIYISTERICKMNNDRSILMRFQEQLALIPKWNQNIIDEEFDRIIKDSGCDWLDELMTAVFLSHTKILAAIKSNDKKNKINLKIPKLDHFIHKCYIESAREIWKNPYLFSSRNNQSEYLRNVRESQSIITHSINETIRKLLPVKNILKEYLGSSYNDEDTLLPESYKENLRKLVKKEIEICKGNNINADIENKIIDNIQNIDLSELKDSENSNLVNNDINDLDLESISLNNKDNTIDINENIKEENIKEENIKEENIKEENINEENIKEENIKEENIKEENIKEENIKEENIKEENIKEENIEEENINFKENNLEIEELDSDLDINTDLELNLNKNEEKNLELKISEKNDNELDLNDIKLDDNIKNIELDDNIKNIELNDNIKNIEIDDNTSDNKKITEKTETNFNEIKEIKNIINNIETVNFNDTEESELDEINLDISQEKNLNSNTIKSELNEIDLDTSKEENNSPNDNSPNDNSPNDNTSNDNTSNDNTSNDNSTFELENMNFTKGELGNLNIDTIPDFDFDSDNQNEEIEKIDDLKTIPNEDIDYVKTTNFSTNERDSDNEENNLKKDDVKTIVIDKDSNKNLKRFTKNKSKNYRFFD